MSLHPTHLSVLESATHGRERRQERGIAKIDLQRARRYGMKEPGRFGREKYTYGGVVFIYDPYTNCEVTCYPSSDYSSRTAGTKCTDPVVLAKVAQDKQDIKKHNKRREHMLRHLEKWRSHSVLVVDMSGSMRRDDVNGARCRSDGVWTALARDFVKRQLEGKTATTRDLVSVVVMKEDAGYILAAEPMDWVLYNKLVDLRNWTAMKPSGPGNYMPALAAAEEALAANTRGSCSLSLMFFSDGKPSDRGNFAEVVGQMASKYGRRLTVCCIGMADDGTENFQTLSDMVTEAEAYGAIASFNKPSMHADSLSNIITSLATSVTATKTEITDIKTGESKLVRTDIRRERRNTPDDENLTDEWIAYRNTRTGDQYVNRIWKWDGKKDGFVYLKDPRCLRCSGTMFGARIQGLPLICPHCSIGGICAKCVTDISARMQRIGVICEHKSASTLCRTCVRHTAFSKHYKTPRCYKCLQDHRTGDLVNEQVTSFAVAMKKCSFGEGAERVVHKLRFLDDKGNFTGPKMVAKQSRFVEMDKSYEDQMDYHREFLRTQVLASRFAESFNNDLDDLVKHFSAQDHAFMRSLPRIEFLQPYVVEVMQNGTEMNILIERQLEGKYEKFNNNMGYVKGQVTAANPGKHDAVDDLIGSFNQFGLDTDGVGGGGLDAIVEGSEDEDSDDEGGVPFDKEASKPHQGVYEDFDERHFPQAFRYVVHYYLEPFSLVLSVLSHFSRRYSYPATIHTKRASEISLLWTCREFSRRRTMVQACTC